MPATLDRTTADFVTVVRKFLLEVLPSGIEVIWLPENKVAPPDGEFVGITPMAQQGMSAGVVRYTDGLRTDSRTQLLPFQLDFYGPDSQNWANVVAILARTEKACEIFASYGAGILPVNAEDPKQLPFVNGEEQYEQRWMVTLVTAIEQSITTTQESATSLEIGLVEVDSSFPPAPLITSFGGQLVETFAGQPIVSGTLEG